jgi:hypothetical protein
MVEELNVLELGCCATLQHRILKAKVPISLKLDLLSTGTNSSYYLGASSSPRLCTRKY